MCCAPPERGRDAPRRSITDLSGATAALRRRRGKRSRCLTGAAPTKAAYYLGSIDFTTLKSDRLLGEVVAVHIDKRLLKDGVYDTAGAGNILRGGGPADYFHIGPEQLFRMKRPD